MIEANVSVVVATYNPVWKKLSLTLESILCQENANIQIVITDDGSKENLFDKVEKFFQQNHFTEYCLVPSDVNQGTVDNILKGLQYCTKEYVKLISPGDFFANSTILCDWLEHLHQSGKKWSFAEAIYYKGDDLAKMEIISAPAHPILIQDYEGKSEKKKRWDYVVLGDIALGATTLAKVDVLKKYIQRIHKKVIYAEDNCYRLMMFDGEVAYYFPKEVIFYEYGEGISTSNQEKWRERLTKDWDEATKEMLKNVNKLDSFQVKMQESILQRVNGTSRFCKILQKGKLRFFIKKSFFPRNSASVIEDDSKQFYKKLI